MLEIKNLNAYYGKSHILQGINLSVNEGEIVSLLGRNGVGRSTVIKSIMGMVKTDGSIKFEGKQILNLPIHEISNAGIGYVSENRDIFPDLTAYENLELGKKNNNSKITCVCDSKIPSNPSQRLFTLRYLLFTWIPNSCYSSILIKSSQTTLLSLLSNKQTI